MKRGKRPLPVELGVALLILVAAVGADLFWVRPRERELTRLASRGRLAEQSATLVLQERGEMNAIETYLNRDLSGPGAWKERFSEADPLKILDGARERAGLRRLDLRLVEQKPVPPFVRTTYFMSMNGSFEKQIGFLKDLELAEPFVTVESFVMNTRDQTPGVDLKLNVSLLTLRPEDAR